MCRWYVALKHTDEEGKVAEVLIHENEDHAFPYQSTTQHILVVLVFMTHYIDDV